MRIDNGRIDLSILICTHNRARSLGRLLDTVTKLQVPPTLQWEVVVIANACCDDTLVVAEAYKQKLPLLAFEEPVAGVSHARNRSLEVARGRLLLCTDDDVSLPRDWLTKHLSAFKRYPSAAFVGGDVVPEFPGAPDAWKRAALKAASSAFASFSVGAQDVCIDFSSPDRLYPFGANMSFRAEIMQTYRYSIKLGRQPGGIFLGGEETQFFLDIVAAGHRGWLISNHPVTHWIESDRQTLEYVKKFYFGQGWQQVGNNHISRPVLSILDRVVSSSLASFFKVMALIMGKTRSDVILIWLERQHSHFSGRLARYRTDVSSDAG